MTAPPLANLFAAYDPDPAAIEAIAARMHTSRDFADIWRPAPGWIAASRPLPGGTPDSARARAEGFAFAEGRDRVAQFHDRDGRDWIGEFQQVVDRSPEHLDRTPGDFGFIRFQSDGAAAIVRSCGGLVPFYLWQSGASLAVSTRLGDLARYIAGIRDIDPLVNAVWTSGYCLFPDRRTFIAGVTLLDRGSMAVVQPDRPIRSTRYWRPRVASIGRPTEERIREHAERLRSRLLDHLRRDLAEDGGNLLTLSGGVDSSSLAALANGVGRDVWTWSLLPGPDASFEAEMAYIGPLLKGLGITRTWTLRVHTPQTARDTLADAPRVVCHVMHPALCALPSILREAPVKVLFGGELADEICGGGGTTPDWAAHTSAMRLVTELRRLPTGSKDLLRWMKHHLLGAVGKPVLPFPGDLPEFISPIVRAEYREWLDRRRRALSRDRLDRPFLAACVDAADFTVMNWEAAGALDVRRSFPFVHREILELAFECHPSELVGPGTKKLLRRALSNDVPAKNLYRADKGAWGAYLRGTRVEWRTTLPELLRPIVRAEWFPAPPAVIDRSAARGLQQLVNFSESFDLARGQQRQIAASTVAPVLTC